MHVFDVGGLGGPTIDFKDSFLNVVDKELQKYQNHLDSTFP